MFLLILDNYNSQDSTKTPLLVSNNKSKLEELSDKIITNINISFEDYKKEISDIKNNPNKNFDEIIFDIANKNFDDELKTILKSEFSDFKVGSYVGLVQNANNYELNVIEINEI